MKKIIFLMLVVLLIASGCGGTNTDPKLTPDDNQTDALDTDEIQNFTTYEFIIPEENASIWPVGVHVPEGFAVEKGLFDSSGSIGIMDENSSARFQFSVIVFNGNTDANLYFEQMIKKERMGSSEFGEPLIESPTPAPFPGEEDITHCEASSIVVSFTREVDEETKIIGEIRLYWFDVRAIEMKKKSASMGFFMLSEAIAEDWDTKKYYLDKIRKSILLLPTKIEILAKMERAGLVENDYPSRVQFAREELELKQMQMRAGIMPAPGWQTSLDTMVPAYSDSNDKYYYVEYKETPSGLLVHPEIQGMTVDPGLSDKLFKYLKDKGL